MTIHIVHQRINTFSSESGFLIHSATSEPAKNKKKKIKKGKDTNGKQQTILQSPKYFLDYKTVRNYSANLIQSF